MWIGGISAAFGVVAVVVWVGWQFLAMSNEVDGFIRSSPESVDEFVIDHQVDWTVFVEPNEASLTGVRFRIWDVEAGREVPLSPYGGSFSYGFPSHSGRAVATVSLQPGTYAIQVEGDGLELAVGASPAGRLVWMLVGGLMIGLPLVIGGGVVAIVSALRQSRRRNRLTAPPQSSAWSSGEWPTGGR